MWLSYAHLMEHVHVFQIFYMLNEFIQILRPL
jgi:hypothetical protein